MIHLIKKTINIFFTIYFKLNKLNLYFKNLKI